MRLRCITAFALANATLCLAAARSDAFELELRVLIVATGDIQSDPGRALMEQTLERIGVPYDVHDASRDDLHAEQLWVSPDRGRYNGIILTESQTYLPGGGTGFDAGEFELLQDYERSFGVREAVLSGFPTTNAALGVDYGMDLVSAGAPTSARWEGEAGGTEIFEYVNTANALPIQGFAFSARPRQSDTGPLVEPLLVDEQNPDYSLVSRLSYPDGREVLLSTLGNATFLLHSTVLAYEFLNFATSGLFIGARHVYLSIHNDDLFLADAVWNPETLSEYPEAEYTYRWTAEEVPLVVAAQARFRSEHPLAKDLTIELAFNGVGADVANDPLTQAIMAHSNDFGFINHTFRALLMDRLCNDDGSCAPTDFATAHDEIALNAQRWAEMGLPHPERALIALLSDSHSGIEDRLGTADISDDVPFPEGFNDDFGAAAEALGIRMLAADASRKGQDSIQRVPFHELVILPRYPTAIFFNVTNPTELVSEYNYLFHDRYLEAGGDPCTIPAALCSPKNYAEILEAEALVTLQHMLGFQPFPHYFHQSNLHVYDEAGHILQFDWLHQVLELYERWMDLPIESPLFHDLADIAWNRVKMGELAPSGVLDVATGTVTLRAASDLTVDITGAAGGHLYGGQVIQSVRVSPTGRRLTVDPAFDR